MDNLRQWVGFQSGQCDHHITQISGTHLASPLWVINQAQWISVEQGPCTLAVVKRYWSMPRMPQIAEFLVMKLAIGKMNTQRDLDTSSLSKKMCHFYIS